MTLRLSAVVVLMSCLASQDLLAQDLISQTAAEQRLEQLETGFSEGWDRFIEDLNAVQDDAEEDLVEARRDEEVRTFAEELLELADQAPRSGNIRATCRRRVLSLMMSDPRLRGFGRRALDGILADPIDEESLRKLTASAPSYAPALGQQSCLDDLERLAGKAADPTGRALVRIATLTLLASSSSSTEDQERAEAIYEELEDLDYPDALREKVARLRFAIEHLRPGCVPPDIVGQDLLGVDMKLSDYRGKVILLDFWGHW